MGSQDSQVTRVSRVLQAPLDFQESMEQGDQKEAKVTQQVISDPLVQRGSQEALDAQDLLEPLEIRACLGLRDFKDHPEDQDHLAPLDHQGAQVTEGCLDSRATQEKWGTPGQEVSWGSQVHRVFLD